MLVTTSNNPPEPPEPRIRGSLHNFRVLAVAGSYYPRIGGGEKYAKRFLEGLVARGISATMLTSVDDIVGEELADGIRTLYVTAKRVAGFPVFSLQQIHRAVSSSKADVIQSFGPSPQDLILAVYARLRSIPYVQVYHADFKAHTVSGRLATWLHNVVACSLAREIIVTNPVNRERLISRGFAATKVHAIIPGIDERFFGNKPAITDEKRILFVGALDTGHAYKRIDLLLEAVAAMRKKGIDVHLDVIGSGETLEMHRTLANQMALAPFVRFHGSVTDSALVEMYARSRALVLPSPSSQEGFGLVCFEAMAGGLPVVCSKNAGVSAVISGAPACFVWNASDIENLASNIELAMNAGLQERLHLKDWTTGYSWDSMNDRIWNEIYSEILEKPAA